MINIVNYKVVFDEIHIPGHDLLLQSCASNVSPLHGKPPLDGDGLLHVRDLV